MPSGFKASHHNPQQGELDGARVKIGLPAISGRPSPEVSTVTFANLLTRNNAQDTLLSFLPKFSDDIAMHEEIHTHKKEWYTKKRVSCGQVYPYLN